MDVALIQSKVAEGIDFRRASRSERNALGAVSQSGASEHHPSNHPPFESLELLSIRWCNFWQAVGQLPGERDIRLLCARRQEPELALHKLEVLRETLLSLAAPVDCIHELAQII